MHGAGATERDAAPELGAVHAEHVAQCPEERHVRRDVELVQLSIDSHGDHASAQFTSRAGGREVLMTAPVAGTTFVYGITISFRCEPEPSAQPTAARF